MDITAKDLNRIIQDAKNRNRKEVYLPSSIYSEDGLGLVKKFYGPVYNVQEVSGTKNGLLISL